MPKYRLQTAVSMDTVNPRDQLVNNLYFDDHGVTTDPGNLCSDLAAKWDAWCSVGNPEITVTAYKVDGPPPHFPEASHTINTGLAPPSEIPREVALCLSFYAGRNLPRQRGRIYLPVCAHTSVTGVRPTTALMDSVLALSDDIAGLGGLDVDWIVYSQTDKVGRNVSHAWVDDEWDTVRRRGLRSTTRSAKDVGP